MEALATAAVEHIFGDFKLESDHSATGILDKLFQGDKEREACIISLSGVLVDACRGVRDEGEIISFLEHEHSLSPDASKAVASAVAKHRQRLGEALRMVSRSSSLQQLHSADWRLDINVGKNDTARSTREPFFHINLKSKAAATLGNSALETKEVSLPSDDTLNAFILQSTHTHTVTTLLFTSTLLTVLPFCRCICRLTLYAIWKKCRISSQL